MDDPSPLHLLVTKLDSHVRLDQQDKLALAGLSQTVHSFRSGAYVVREGEKPDSCPVLVQGFAFRQKLVRNGGRQILAVQLPGDILDLQHLFLDFADHSVQALGDVRVALISRPGLQALAMERPAIAHALAVNNQVEASIGREWLLNVGRRDAQRRLAHLLCEVATRLEQQGLASQYGYTLPMSQEELGDATGLTSVHVNRSLKALEQGGWIERDKRTIRFPNWRALKQMADFDPLYLHIGRQSAPNFDARSRQVRQRLGFDCLRSQFYKIVQIKRAARQGIASRLSANRSYTHLR